MLLFPPCLGADEVSCYAANGRRAELSSGGEEDKVGEPIGEGY